MSALSALWTPDYALSLPASLSNQRRRDSSTLVYAKRRRYARWQWHGTIIGRAWPADMDPRDVLAMRLDATARRLALPDALTQDGVPIYYMDAARRRRGQRLLDRACRDGYEAACFLAENIACNAGRTVMLNFIANTGGLTGVQYYAVGTGTLPAGGPVASDTQLATEFYRQTPTTVTVSGNLIDVSTTFLAGTANTTYTEAGIFGDGATGTANSGQLFAHAAVSYTKSAATVLTNDYDVTLS